MVVVLSAIRFLLWLTDAIPVQPLASRAATIMTGYCIGEVLVSTLQVATQLRFQSLVNLPPLVLDLTVSCFWATWFVSAGKLAPRDLPAPSADCHTAVSRSAGNIEALRRTVRQFSA
jgi:hypothetical protein